jgi:deazaflavin-dependent oxidoreductase (nitroreductase family)
VGTKSGKVRKNPVMRIVDGDRYVAVASAGGAPANPSWYANLVAHPRVRLQDGIGVREFLAREVTGDQKRYYWTVAERFWPHFPEYRQRSGGRDIPIMVLEPITPHREGTAMATGAEERNKALVLEAFDTLFNRRDHAAAQRFWSPDYIQHSGHIEPGRDGLFNLIKASPADMRYENAADRRQRRLCDAARPVLQHRVAGQLDRCGHRAPARRPARRTLGCPAGRGHRRAVPERAAHVWRHLPDRCRPR